MRKSIPEMSGYKAPGLKNVPVFLLRIIILLVFCSTAQAQVRIINTLAGGGSSPLEFGGDGETGNRCHFL